MDIIARFPRLPPLDDEAVTTPRPQAERPTPPHRERMPAAGAAARRAPAFPTTSVAVLAVVAALAWSLAAWHDTVRLARQQRPERLALQPPSASQPTTP